MALLYRYYPLALENISAHFWLLLLQLFLFLCLFLLLKIVFFIIINSYVGNKVDLTWLDLLFILEHIHFAIPLYGCFQSLVSEEKVKRSRTSANLIRLCKIHWLLAKRISVVHSCQRGVVSGVRTHNWRHEFYRCYLRVSLLVS